MWSYRTRRESDISLFARRAADKVCDKDRLLTVKQVAQMVGLPVSTIYECLGLNELRGTKKGKRWQIRRGDVEVWLDSQQHWDIEQWRKSMRKYLD